MTREYELYTYFRSSCSARVRIAALLKGIPLTYKYIHLLNGEQRSDSYTAINTSGSVPTLIITEENGHRLTIQQSIAILEFFEESRPELPALLPPDAENRARVRELVNIVACDIQPVTNLKILSMVQRLGMDTAQWQKEHMSRGLEAYERLLQRSPLGHFSIGDALTMADVVLAPAVDGALRFGVELAAFPNIKRVCDATQSLDAFQQGAWNAQPDTPAKLRRM